MTSGKAGDKNSRPNDEQIEMRVDMKYVRQDIAEIKQAIKDQAKIYVTREQLAAAFAPRDEQLTELQTQSRKERERNTFYIRTGFTVILTALVGFIVLLFQLYGARH